MTFPRESTEKAKKEEESLEMAANSHLRRSFSLYVLTNSNRTWRRNAVDEPCEEITSLSDTFLTMEQFRQYFPSELESGELESGELKSGELKSGELDSPSFDCETRIESEFLEEPLAQELPGITEGEIIVIRSTRRKRNIAAYRQGGQIVVSIPARLSKADERMVVPEMVAKIRAQEATRVITDSALGARVTDLLAQWASEISERPFSVSWRENMKERWGSCTNVDGTIRISARLQHFPEYVLDYVLFHEGIHLRYGDHGAQFQELIARFPRGELAQAYLDGYEAAENALTPPVPPRRATRR